MVRVLYLDGDFRGEINTNLNNSLEEAGFDLEHVNLDEAVQKLESTDHRYECVVARCGQRLDSGGFELLGRIRKVSEVPVLFLMDREHDFDADVENFELVSFGEVDTDGVGERISNLIARNRQDKALESVVDAYFALDDEWRITHLNERAESLMQRRVEDVIGEVFWDEFPGLDETAFYEEFTRSMEEGEAVKFEEYYAPLDTWFDVRANPSDAVLSVYLRDITERREREKELELKERAMDESTVGITISDPSQPDNPLIYANDAFERITGYSSDEVMGRNCRFLQGGDTDPEKIAEIRNGVRDEEPVSVEILNYTKDGDEFWNRLTITPVGDDSGDVTHYVGIQDDITVRKNLEEEILARNQHLRELYEITSDPDKSFEDKVQLMLELGCDVLDVNIGFVSSIDEKMGEFEVIESRGDHKLIQRGAESPLADTYCRKVVSSGDTVVVQNASQQGWSDDPAYQKYNLECYLGAKITVGNEVFGTLCFASKNPREKVFTEDERTFVELMTEWLSYEMERREHEKHLQIKNDRLEDFASVVSHDLRNPLNVAKGHVEIAKQAKQEYDEERLETALEAIERMEKIIDDVLKLARQGDTVTEKDVVDLREAAEEAWENCNLPRARLEIELDDNTVRADESRLLAVFENLFRNSVDHGNESALVRVGPLENGFYVEDDGPGIPEEERDEVFERGYTTRNKGTGFGLSIVKEIAEAHGWSIELSESDEGGARFEFYYD